MTKPSDPITFLETELEFEPCHDYNELEPENEANLTRSEAMPLCPKGLTSRHEVSPLGQAYRSLEVQYCWQMSLAVLPQWLTDFLNKLSMNC